MMMSCDADVMLGGGCVCQHAKCRSLREELYRAFITRASSGGSDNGPIIERILVLRRERAELLGFSNHAEVDRRDMKWHSEPCIMQ